MAVPSRNCAWVHTEATVVISLIVTLAGGLLPITVMSAMAGLSPLALAAVGLPALGDQIEARIRAGGVGSGHREVAIGAGFCLCQLLGRTRTRGKKRHCRAGNRSTSAKDLTFKFRSGSRSGS